MHDTLLQQFSNVLLPGTLNYKFHGLLNTDWFHEHYSNVYSFKFYFLNINGATQLFIKVTVCGLNYWGLAFKTLNSREQSNRLITRTTQTNLLAFLMGSCYITAITKVMLWLDPMAMHHRLLGVPRPHFENSCTGSTNPIYKTFFCFVFFSQALQLQMKFFRVRPNGPSCSSHQTFFKSTSMYNNTWLMAWLNISILISCINTETSWFICVFVRHYIVLTASASTEENHLEW